ncbi:MAG: hypothetical protein AAGI44_05935 [Pseudomonadota bacterium]
MPQEPSPHFRLRRVLIAAAVGIAIVGTLSTIGRMGYHRYRVWQANGVWCALGNDMDGWQVRYGEENCPDL